MRLRLISYGNNPPEIADENGGDSLKDVIGFTLERAYDADAKPLPYMLLNVTVRIDDEAAEPEQVDPLDMTD